mmetsp:Transcript_12088/g.17830  ORF Transcript_12088/g.17830 Transcript_12088/m.17830 type:complete len:224 (+) Transcript_12088:171-842(+)
MDLNSICFIFQFAKLQITLLKCGTKMRRALLKVLWFDGHAPDQLQGWAVGGVNYLHGLLQEAAGFPQPGADLHRVVCLCPFGLKGPPHFPQGSSDNASPAAVKGHKRWHPVAPHEGQVRAAVGQEAHQQFQATPPATCVVHHIADLIVHLAGPRYHQGVRASAHRCREIRHVLDVLFAAHVVADAGVVYPQKIKLDVAGFHEVRDCLVLDLLRIWSVVSLPPV